ncbi:hypothetical protein T06_16362 [Trichinella sp. T6]|nr:hypothetical protein T06_16362 [Trichinella sp. T6]
MNICAVFYTTVERDHQIWVGGRRELTYPRFKCFTGFRVVLLPDPADWAVTAFAKEFKMRNAAAFSAMSIFKVNREPLFIRLLHLQSGLCHCRVDADVLFVPLGL